MNLTNRYIIEVEEAFPHPTVGQYAVYTRRHVKTMSSLDIEGSRELEYLDEVYLVRIYPSRKTVHLRASSNTSRSSLLERRSNLRAASPGEIKDQKRRKLP